MSRARPENPPLVGHSIVIPVRFAECDAYSVVWHGHYALYLEQVRESLTGRFGFSAARALEMGYRVPITRMEIRYRLPATPDTLVRVTGRLRPPNVARFLLDYEVRSEPEGILLATAQTEQVVVNRKGELMLRLPAGLQTMAEEIVKYQNEL